MDGDRFSIAEIRKALGGQCDWVTRRMLKRAGSPFPDCQQIAVWAERPPEWVSRERDLAGAALAMQPGSAARAVVQALVTPAGPGDHLVKIGAWSTSVTVAPDGSIEIENPAVCAALHRMVTEGAEAGIIVRSFTSETSHMLPDGTDIPVKEIRGWHLRNGVFHRLDEQAMFAASCTDAGTGEALAPERGVRHADAFPVVT